jgi:hypothetical protein
MNDTRVWHIAGRHFASLPADWRARLATRLGCKPRRIGAWAEMAMYGALACLDDAGEPGLPDTALLSVASLAGPQRALRDALESARDGFPMPLGFLQSQPNQILASLGTALDWRGDARMLATRDPLAALQLACVESGESGALLGWVEEQGETSAWLRLRPAQGNAGVRVTDFVALADPAITHLQLD